MTTTRKPEIAAKFDASAADYDDRYADARAVAHRQVGLVRSWVEPVAAGARVLELGCANGFVTNQLARAGFDVISVDLSAAMLLHARHRVETQLGVRLLAGDIDRLPLAPSTRVDVVLGLLATFFHYSDDPAAALRRLAAFRPQKLLVDMHTRTLSVGAARSALQDAGFRSFAWRPFVAPHRARLPASAYGAVSFAERTPGLRSALHTVARPNVVCCATDLV